VGAVAGSSWEGAETLPIESRFHPLDERSIASSVRVTAPGSFLLGYFDGATFRAFYVGRSDTDVAASLRSWVDAPSCPRRERVPRYWAPRSASSPGHGRRRAECVPFGIDTGYTHFAFRYAPSAVEAFEHECRDYHALGGCEQLDNQAHPQPPRDSPSGCPMHG
jgi:hypothetical protein